MIEQQRITTAKLAALGFAVTQTKTGHVATLGTHVLLRVEMHGEDETGTDDAQFFTVNQTETHMHAPPTMASVILLIDWLQLKATLNTNEVRK